MWWFPWKQSPLAHGFWSEVLIWKALTPKTIYMSKQCIKPISGQSSNKAKIYNCTCAVHANNLIIKAHVYQEVMQYWLAKWQLQVGDMAKFIIILLIKRLSKIVNIFKFLIYRLNKFHVNSDCGFLYKAMHRFL